MLIDEPPVASSPRCTWQGFSYLPSYFLSQGQDYIN